MSDFFSGADGVFLLLFTFSLSVYVVYIVILFKNTNVPWEDKHRINYLYKPCVFNIQLNNEYVSFYWAKQ